MERQLKSESVITLFSNAQPDIFPKNTAYQFTNRLPHPCHLNNDQLYDWQIALTEFSTLNTLDTTPTDLKVRVKIPTVIPEHNQEQWPFSELKTPRDTAACTTKAVW